jgi:hypothetical protein
VLWWQARNVTINRNLTQLRFERPEPELELGQKNNSPSKQLSKRDRNDWGGRRSSCARTIHGSASPTSEDRPRVVESIRQLIARGDYPEKLW